MSISRTAQRHSPVVWMVVLAAMLFGAVSYFTLPAREDPDITIREAVVTTRYPGLSAERMELLVTKTLEEAIRQVPEIDEIRSTSQPGLSIIHAEVYDSYFDLEQIWDEVRNEIDAAEGDLPAGASDPIVDSNFGDVAVVTAALTSEDWEMAAMFDTAQHVRDRLYQVEDTKRVEILGAQEERVFIETKNAQLAEFGLSPGRMIEAVRAQNTIRPGGEIDAGPRSFVVEPTGDFQSVEALREMRLRVPGTGETVKLRDVAEVRHGYVDPPVRPAYFNGEEAIVFAVSMLEGRSVLDHAGRVKKRLAEIEATLPAGYSIDVMTYQARQVSKAINGVSSNVAQTLAIVLAVVVLFLGVRTGLIVGSIVPTVMLITLAVMQFAGIELQRMSLATLVLALGILVDNGIVVAEDFKRRVEEGQDRDEVLAAVGRELAVPLLISTLTTILVFLPLMLAEHVAGEYTRSISLIVLIALSVSWLLAMTVVPMLCHRFIEAKPKAEADDEDGGETGKNGGFERLNRGYEWLLRRVILRARLPFLALVGAAMVAAVFAIGEAPKKFFPNSDRAQALVYVDLPAGVTARKTEAAMERAFEKIDAADIEGLSRHAGYVGFGGPRFVLSLTPIDPAPNKGFVVAQFERFEQVQPGIAELRRIFREELPEMDGRVSSMFLGPSDSTKIEVQVIGPDADHVFAMSERLEGVLRRVPGATHIYNDWENRIPKIRVAVDQTRARRAGVTSTDVARSLEGYFSGRFVSEFREGDDVYPILARAEGDERAAIERMRTMTVYAAASDAAVPLGQVADLETVSEHSRIAREKLTRTATVQAKNTIMTAQDMVPLMRADLDALREDLAPGHAIEFDGVVAESRDAQAAITASLPLCIGIVAVLLVAQFNSYKRAAIIFATVPLLVIGAAIGLYALGANFGFMPILGLYALAGILVNNAIVLIDRIDIERTTTDKLPFDALVDASVRRLRPILMTTVTTILGLMPLIVFVDALFFGLAAVMAFGLAVGSLCVLGVVPVLYAYAFGIRPGRENAAF